MELSLLLSGAMQHHSLCKQGITLQQHNTGSLVRVCFTWSASKQCAVQAYAQHGVVNFSCGKDVAQAAGDVGGST